MPPLNTERFMRFFLENTPLIQAEATDLIDRFEPVYLKENDYFLKAGMPVRRIGYLDKGILCRYIIDGKGNDAVLQFISEGHFFTDLDGFFRKQASGTYIRAITPCQLLTLSLCELETLRQNQPKFDAIIYRISMQNLYERIKSEHFIRRGNSTEKYRYFVTHFPHLAQQVPLKYIASYLCITQQSLSRIRRQMQ